MRIRVAKKLNQQRIKKRLGENTIVKFYATQSLLYSDTFKN